MRQMIIALGLIKQGRSYLLQLRDGPAKIGGAGLIGCFGGKLEDGEDPKTGARREISEETNLISDIKQWQSIGVVEVMSDHNLEPVRVMAHIFSIDVPEDFIVVAKEGRLVIIGHDDLHRHLPKMTPGTRALFETYILGD